jgi:hypothetical protein
METAINCADAGDPLDEFYVGIAHNRLETWISLIPAAPVSVPLDKLCEWLETNCILSCVECEHLFGGQWCKQHPELPYRCHRKEHWKNVLTKWMEGLDDHR